MPINHLQLVNQKLAFANSIIASLELQPSDLTTTQALQQRALKDSVVFHLATALRFYVRELAELHRVANVRAINSIDDLAAALNGLDKVSPEVSELVEVGHAPDSWLNQLIRYYNQLFDSPEKAKEKKAFGQENTINLIELREVDDVIPIELTIGVLAVWLDNFRALIARQRETSAEY